MNSLTSLTFGPFSCGFASLCPFTVLSSPKIKENSKHARCSLNRWKNSLHWEKIAKIRIIRIVVHDGVCISQSHWYLRENRDFEGNSSHLTSPHHAHHTTPHHTTPHHTTPHHPTTPHNTPHHTTTHHTAPHHRSPHHTVLHYTTTPLPTTHITTPHHTTPHHTYLPTPPPLLPVCPSVPFVVPFPSFFFNVWYMEQQPHTLSVFQICFCVCLCALMRVDASVSVSAHWCVVVCGCV